MPFVDSIADTLEQFANKRFLLYSWLLLLGLAPLRYKIQDWN